MNEPQPFAIWEFVAWACVAAVGLIVLHAVFQYEVSRANESHVIPPAPLVACHAVGRGVICIKRPASSAGTSGTRGRSASRPRR